MKEFLLVDIEERCVYEYYVTIRWLKIVLKKRIVEDKGWVKKNLAFLPLIFRPLTLACQGQAIFVRSSIAESST